MNKLISSLSVLFLFCASVALAQSWTIYKGDVDPLSFSPAFEASQQAGVFSNAVEDDPGSAGNKLLHMTTTDNADGSNDNNQWRQQLATATAVTVVFRAKGNDSARPLLFDMDMDFNGFRSQVRIQPNGTLGIANGTADGTPAALTVNTQEWNTYRFTRNGSSFALYVNESSTPAVTGTAATAGTNAYFRFGDGWGAASGVSQTMDTHFDWVIWDASGAYTPSGSAIPTELTEAAQIPLGTWTTYNGDVDPLTFTPAFEASQQAGVFSNAIENDPIRVGNKLLHMTTTDNADGSNDNNQWRQQLGTATAITVVFRAKGNDSAKPLLFDMDMDFNGFRSQIRIQPNGTLGIANGTADGTPAALTVNTQEWNTYRFTRNGSSFALYVNESTTPAVTGTAATAGTNAFFRFGDGWGAASGVSQTIDTHFDWVIWDVTGAYTPAQTRISNDLLKAPVGTWTTYEADVDPLSFSPAFEASQQAGVFSNAIEDDASSAGNKVLHMTTTDNADGSNDNNQWRQQLGTATSVTVVFKVKGNDSNRPLLFDLDMDFNGFRSQIRVQPNGTLSIANGTADATPAALTVNTQEWNTYRFTRSGSAFALYVNESTTAAVTGTAATAGTNSYFRFGDGWGAASGVSQTMDSYFDYVVWDVTGGYTPAQTRLPDNLTGEVEATPSITIIGAPDALSQDIGFATDFTTDSYIVSGKDLTAAITITPPANFEVSLNQTDWFTASSPLSLSPSSGIVDATDVYVRLNATAIGDFTGDISHTSTGAEEVKVAISGAAINLTPEITLTGTLEAFTQNVSNPSESQIYRVSGVNLKGDLTVTAPDNFQVSSDQGVTWASSVALQPTERTITNAIVAVRLNATALGDYEGAITHSATDASDVTLSVAGEVIPDPGITVTGDFSAFSHSVGVPSESQSYSVAGTNLADAIAIAMPDGYEISFNDELWLNSISLAPLDGNVEEITLFIRLNGTSAGDHSGDIVHSSTGVSAVSKAVTGTTDAASVLSVHSKVSLNFWPNPSSELITLERGDVTASGVVTVLSVDGSNLLQKAVSAGQVRLDLDITQLPQGLYLINYQSGGEQTIMKFWKK